MLRTEIVVEFDGSGGAGVFEGWRGVADGVIGRSGRTGPAGVRVFQRSGVVVLPLGLKCSAGRGDGADICERLLEHRTPRPARGQMKPESARAELHPCADLEQS